MTPASTKKSSLQNSKTDVKAPKIDESSLDMFEMVIAGFWFYIILVELDFFKKRFYWPILVYKWSLECFFLLYIIQTFNLQKKSLDKELIISKRLYLVLEG